MVNILSGGLHARDGMDIQDVLAVPLSARTMIDAIHMAARVREAAASLCSERGITTLLADEGGISPGCRTGREALVLMVASIERAGLQPGTDVGIALDVAAASLYDAAAGDYVLAREGRRVSRDGMIDMIAAWVDEFPIVSVEDPLDEDDWEGWASITQHLGGRVQLIGDDLFTTNPHRLSRGIKEGCATSVLIKLNQNGTLTGTLDVVRSARDAGYALVASARSGETEDDLLADLAVGAATGQIKVGSVRSSERLAKYNQLIRIAEDPSIPFSTFPRPGRVPVGEVA
jgi:enolase